MKIDASTTDFSLIVNVHVPAISSEVVYLKNWLFDWYGLSGDPNLDLQRRKDAPPTQSLAFVCSQGKTLGLLQGNPPPPPLGVSVFAPRVPLATRVSPGDEFRGRIALPVPLPEWTAYQTPKTDNVRPVSVQRIHLRLEYVRQSTCTYAKELPAFRGVWQVSGQIESLEATTSLDSPVILLERRDAFKRFK
jgi:hypothetical protein